MNEEEEISRDFESDLGTDTPTQDMFQKKPLAKPILESLKEINQEESEEYMSLLETESKNPSQSNFESTINLVEETMDKAPKLLEVLIKEICDRRSQVWEVDDKVNQCKSCRKQFHILARRRHHCRWCGQIFCDKCSGNKVYGLSKTSLSRVCNECLLLWKEAHLVDFGENLKLNLDALMTYSCVNAEFPDRSDDLLELCPVYSLNFENLNEIDVQEHLSQCFSQSSKCTIGDRYLVKILDEDLMDRECGICFEEFLKGQSIATLTCFCQYHEDCISQWFDRGKLCPVHEYSYLQPFE